MKFKILILLITFSKLVACYDPSKEPNSKQHAAKTITSKCYRYINNNDTVILKAMYVDDAVTGTLMYNLFEKDKNKGTIVGHMKGVLLIADYTFMSEGVQSIRQVVFKKTPNGFMEGYGNIEEKNGRTIFKNIDSLTFDNSILLTETSCDN